MMTTKTESPERKITEKTKEDTKSTHRNEPQTTNNARRLKQNLISQHSFFSFIPFSPSLEKDAF
jgi:hypothetical protein